MQLARGKRRTSLACGSVPLRGSSCTQAFPTAPAGTSHLAMHIGREFPSPTTRARRNRRASAGFCQPTPPLVQGSACTGQAPQPTLDPAHDGRPRPRRSDRIPPCTTPGHRRRNRRDHRSGGRASPAATGGRSTRVAARQGRSGGTGGVAGQGAWRDRGRSGTGGVAGQGAWRDTRRGGTRRRGRHPPARRWVDWNAGWSTLGPRRVPAVGWPASRRPSVTGASRPRNWSASRSAGSMPRATSTPSWRSGRRGPWPMPAPSTPGSLEARSPAR
jgi:hypothetical protein